MIFVFENVIADIFKLNGVKGVYIADMDGNLVESESTREDDEILAALVVELFKKSSDIMAKISNGDVNFLVVENSKDRLIITKASELILGVFSESSVNYGLLKIEIKKAAEKIEALV